MTGNRQFLRENTVLHTLDPGFRDVEDGCVHLDLLRA